MPARRAPTTASPFPTGVPNCEDLIGPRCFGHSVSHALKAVIGRDRSWSRPSANPTGAAPGVGGRGAATFQAPAATGCSHSSTSLADCRCQGPQSRRVNDVGGRANGEPPERRLPRIGVECQLPRGRAERGTVPPRTTESSDSRRSSPFWPLRASAAESASAYPSRGARSSPKLQSPGGLAGMEATGECLQALPASNPVRPHSRRPHNPMEPRGHDDAGQPSSSQRFLQPSQGQRTARGRCCPFCRGAHSAQQGPDAPVADRGHEGRP